MMGSDLGRGEAIVQLGRCQPVRQDHVRVRMRIAAHPISEGGAS